MIKKLLTFFKKEAPSLNEEKKVHVDILNNIFKLKQKIGLIIDYEKIFIDILYSLIDDEIITLNEFLKILQYIEKLSVAK